MAHQDETEAPARPSLYDRLGGVYNIAPVVDDLIDRVMGDPRLNANPRVDEAHHRVSAAGFKYFVTEMLCQAAGGPQQYSGRSMGDSHRHLMITDEEWLAFMDDLQQTLDKFGVPQPEQNEIKVIVESTQEASRHRFQLGTKQSGQHALLRCRGLVLSLWVRRGQELGVATVRFVP
jgi:hemoglobin